MASTGALVTAEELLDMPDDHLRHELVAGRLTSMSPPGFLHGLCVNRLATRLTAFVQARGLGVVVQDTGFLLTRAPDTVRAPDVAFIAAARIRPGAASENYWDGAPDLAIEVISPGERSQEIQAKAREYLACGCRGVWIVRPRNCTISVHHVGGDERIFVDPDVLEDAGVLEGFTLPLAEVFCDAPGPHARRRRNRYPTQSCRIQLGTDGR